MGQFESLLELIRIQAAKQVNDGCKYQTGRGGTVKAAQPAGTLYSAFMTVVLVRNLELG